MFVALGLSISGCTWGEAPTGSQADLLFVPVAADDVEPCEPPAQEYDDGGCLIVEGTLGATKFNASIVESAKAIESGFGDDIVSLTFTEDGIKKFNSIAAECFNKTEICPTGKLAIFSEGRLLTAPSINSPTFERSDVQISGNFSQGEANAIADSING